MAMKCSFDATHGLVMRFFHITGSPFRVRHQLLYAVRRTPHHAGIGIWYRSDEKQTLRY